MYEGDSFLTLSLMGRIGLVAVSISLALAAVWLVARVGRARHLLVRIALAVAVLWAFVWLSPQLYYLYYMAIFDGLPVQIVIKAPPGITDIMSLLSFSDRSNLSNHSKGGLGWVLIGLSLWGWYRARWS